MANYVEMITVVAVVMIGSASALDCLTCIWDAKNGSLEDSCLGAPYKSEISTCESDSQSQRFVCQTTATYAKTLGMKHLTRLERSCSKKHASCNNECALDTTMCWLCCNDNDKCNGFPTRQNIVIISSATNLHHVFAQILLCASIMLFAKCV